MNLQPIYPLTPVFEFACYSCGKPYPSTMPGACADLDKAPFAAYFCGPCATTAREASTYQEAIYGTANDSEIGPEIYPTTFYVVRVNGDNLDTHAAETLEEALELAMPDDGSTVHYGTVTARDAGAARLMQPETWSRYTPAELQLFARTGPVLALRLASGRPYRAALEAVDAVKGVGPSWIAVNGPHVAFSGPTTCTAEIPSPKTPRVAAQAPKL